MSAILGAACSSAEPQGGPYEGTRAEVLTERARRVLAGGFLNPDQWDRAGCPVPNAAGTEVEFTCTPHEPVYEVSPPSPPRPGEPCNEAPPYPGGLLHEYYRARSCWFVYHPEKDWYWWLLGGRLQERDSGQGVILVLDSGLHSFLTPDRSGPASIYSVRWRDVCFTTRDGGVGIFDPVRGTFASPAEARRTCPAPPD